MMDLSKKIISIQNVQNPKKLFVKMGYGFQRTNSVS